MRILAAAVGVVRPNVECHPTTELVLAGGGAAGRASWLLRYLQRAPLLDDRRLRRLLPHLPGTRLAEVAEAWAFWCLSDRG